MTFLLGLFILIIAPLLLIIIGGLTLWLGIKVVCFVFGGS